MNQALYSLVTQRDEMRIIYSGDISARAAQSLQQTIPHLVNYYEYERVTWVWESDGGEAAGAQAIWGLMQQLRLQGVRQCCLSDHKAMSAAAVLLTLGDWGERTVTPNTQLLYHYARLLAPGGAPIDQQGAARIMRRLNNVDKALLDTIVNHVSNGQDVAGLRSTLQHRTTWLRENWSDVCHHWQQQRALCSGVDLSTSQPRWLANAARESAVTNDQWLMNYRRALGRLFAEDRPTSPLRAWCLGLIDQVHGITPSGRETPQRAHPRRGDVDTPLCDEPLPCRNRIGLRSALDTGRGYAWQLGYRLSATEGGAPKVNHLETPGAA